jgi:hypothetical protein
MNARTAQLIHKMSQRLGVSEKILKRRWLALNAKQRGEARRNELRL